MAKDLAIEGGEALVFRPLQQGAYVDDSRVVCPKCTKAVARKKARRHCRSCQVQITGARARKDGGSIDDLHATVEPGRKRLHSDVEDSSTIWEKMCRSVPSNILRPLMDNLNATPFHINGCAMILSVEAQELLRSILPQEYSISKIDFSQEKANDDIANAEDRLKDTHEPVTSEHLSVIESGDENGLERLMGAVIVTGVNNFGISCAETYFRDSGIDPHVEPLDAFPSSVPTEERLTQYNGRLKVVKTSDIGNNKKLVIGVRAFNYLMTEGFNNGNIRVGPGRCAEGFEVNDRTRLFVKSERQDPHILSGDILSCGQLRSKFGHPFTYLPIRSALVGYASVPVMPVTVFTLSQFGAPFSEIFRHLATSAKPGVEKYSMPGARSILPDHLSRQFPDIHFSPAYSVTC